MQKKVANTILVLVQTKSSLSIIWVWKYIGRSSLFPTAVFSWHCFAQPCSTWHSWKSKYTNGVAWCMHRCITALQGVLSDKVFSPLQNVLSISQAYSALMQYTSSKKLCLIWEMAVNREIACDSRICNPVDHSVWCWGEWEMLVTTQVLVWLSHLPCEVVKMTGWSGLCSKKRSF